MASLRLLAALAILQLLGAAVSAQQETSGAQQETSAQGGIATSADIVAQADRVARTQGVIASYLQRTNSLLIDGPDKARQLRGQHSVLWGRANGFSAPLAVVASGSDHDLNANFATSLGRITAADEAAQRERLASLGKDAPPARRPAVAPAPFDLWTEGHYKIFSDDGGGVSRDGALGVVYAGADYLFAANAATGMLVRFDWADERSRTLQSRTSGRSVMAGPYVTTRLGQHLVFHAHTAWGRGAGTVSPDLTYRDSLRSDRWIATGSLTGNWAWGDFRLAPNAEVRYSAQSQHGYDDAHGLFIPGQPVSLGRFSAGPEVGWSQALGQSTTLEVQAALDALWNFHSHGPNAVTSVGYGENTLRMKMRTGAAVLFDSGVQLRAVGEYDGIDVSGFDAFGGRLSLSMPLRGGR